MKQSVKIGQVLEIKIENFIREGVSLIGGFNLPVIGINHPESASLKVGG